MPRSPISFRSLFLASTPARWYVWWYLHGQNSANMLQQSDSRNFSIPALAPNTLQPVSTVPHEAPTASAERGFRLLWSPSVHQRLQPPFRGSFGTLPRSITRNRAKDCRSCTAASCCSSRQRAASDAFSSTVLPESYGFPGACDIKRPMSEAATNAALRRLGYDARTELTGRRFRAMARTILHEELEEPFPFLPQDSGSLLSSSRRGGLAPQRALICSGVSGGHFTPILMMRSRISTSFL
ncbi:hypothetical protein QFZ97_000531 [Paraburkholderia youngii]